MEKCYFFAGTNLLISALFWVLMQLEVVISHRNFGSTHQSHLQGSRIQKFFTPDDETDTLSRNVGKKLNYSLLNNPEERSFHLLHGRSL